jgi:hypothetical protein
VVYGSRCGGCGEALLEGDRFCGNCGRLIVLEPMAPAGSPASVALQPDRRYGSLRVIALLYTVLAWLTLVLGAIGVIVGSAKSEDITGGGKFGLILGGLLLVAFYALFLFAAAAFIRLFLSIEQNTRETAQTSRETVGLLTR